MDQAQWVSKASALIILDCDGVLVDSESLASGVELAELRRHGCVLSLDEYLSLALGRTEEEEVWLGIAERSGVSLPSDFPSTTRAKVAARFERSLKPITGVANALSRLAFPKCVASGSPPARLFRSLESTGLLQFFDGCIFSAVEVPRGKPHPDLFLHAAARMGADPARCIVVEDSPAGVRAGKAAGMSVLGFTGASHCSASLPGELLRLGCRSVFADMKNLPDLCRELATEV